MGDRLRQWVGLALLCAILSFPFWDSWAQDTPGAQAQRFRLHYKKEGFSLSMRRIAPEAQEVVFKKEPEFSGKDVIRGAIPINADRKEFVGFAMDRAADTLYVDLNRNLDLTDDPEGIYHGKRAGGLLAFPRIHLEAPCQNALLPYELLMLWGTDPRYRFSQVEIVSHWEGVIELAGKTRRIAFLENMDGSFNGLDRLVVGRDEVPFDEPINAMGPLSISLPSKLFMDGHGYELSLAPDGTDIMASLGKWDTPVRQLPIEGQYVYRVVLCEIPGAQGATVILDAPEPIVSVPMGRYLWNTVYLDGGESAGMFESSSLRVLSITRTEPASLRLGGPLKHKVEMQRSGPWLVIGDVLTGVGDEDYIAVTRNYQRRPTFCLYKGTYLLTAGNFEYG